MEFGGSRMAKTIEVKALTHGQKRQRYGAMASLGSKKSVSF